MVWREAEAGGGGGEGAGAGRCSEGCDGGNGERGATDGGEAVSWWCASWMWVAWSSRVGEDGTFSPVSVLSSGSTGWRCPSSLRRTRNGLPHDEQRTLKR